MTHIFEGGQFKPYEDKGAVERSENPGGVSINVVVEPLVYFAFLFFNETVITKAQGLVVAIAKKNI